MKPAKDVVSAAASRKPDVVRPNAASPARVAIPILLIALGWAYWSVLVGLWGDWQDDPNYSVGQLVPLLALYLLWHKRASLRGCPISPGWWGLALLALAQLIRLAGYVFLYGSLERFALWLSIVALTYLIAGRKLVWRLRWIFLFLALALPLPGRVHNAISGPLQESATRGTVFVLELAGTDVTRHGNVLSLGAGTPVGVAEACSGLRMLTAFVIVAAVLAFLLQRPVWQRVVLLVSSVPVAIVCNVVRLVATAWFFSVSDHGLAVQTFHDFAGIAMMPLAIAILLGEVWLMGCLVEPDPDARNAHKR